MSVICVAVHFNWVYFVHFVSYSGLK